ncbi:hypothetical protein [Candidatus Fukatsuia endosymbiont of Tuberolachnus salignus]|uniref:hypothetical protein n=1 Tax=Candidatus Fukatsuia endosymbiont of Tuberolachnus salignus TaxID=3077957 RepID=UPI00313E2091
MSTCSITGLKQQLIKSKELNTVWNYFFDLMKETGSLRKDNTTIPKPKEEDTLIAVLTIIENIVGQKLDRKVTFINLMFNKVSDSHFYHGFCMIKGFFQPLSIFYFLDVEMGSFLYNKNGRSEMFRFSLTTTTDPNTLIKH